MSKRVSHRLLAVVVVAATVAGALAPASTAGALAAPAAPRPIAVWLNGTRISFDVPPTTEGGRTLVPVRAIFEAMGAKVDWDQATRTATAVKDDLTIRLQADNKAAEVNGRSTTLDVPARIVSGRTLVPLRFVAEALGAQVGWYNGSRAITINTVPVDKLQAAQVAAVLADGRIQLAGGDVVSLTGLALPAADDLQAQRRPFAPQAIALLQRLLPAGQAVRLESDVAARDAAGREWRYVYLADGTLVNAALADAGLAEVDARVPNTRYAGVFLDLQDNAFAGKRGMWAAEPPAPAPPNAGANLRLLTDGQTAYSVVAELTDPKYAGRQAGSAGYDAASQYIADQFKALGLVPAGDDGTYFQTYPQDFSQFSGPMLLREITPAGTRDYVYQQDFTADPTGFSGTVSAGVVFAGYGITATDLGYDDYAGLDVSGKIVLAIRRNPAFLPGRGALDDKLRNAQKHGAKSLILIDNPREPGFHAQLDGGQGMVGIQLVHVTTALGDQWLKGLGLTTDGVISQIERDRKPVTGKPVTAATNITLELTVHAINEHRTARNVLGVIPGRSGSKGKHIVISAHMDGLGVDANGTVYPSANDNASGTGAIVEVARYFSQPGNQPPVPIVIVAFGSEEQRFEGSRYYVDHPALPLTDAIADLTVDVVGGLSPSINLVLPQASESLRSPALLSLQSLHLPGRVVSEEGGSDHATFAARGVPALMVGNNTARYAHARQDDMRDISPTTLAAAASYVINLASRLGGADTDIDPISWAGVKNAPANQYPVTHEDDPALGVRWTVIKTDAVWLYSDAAGEKMLPVLAAKLEPVAGVLAQYTGFRPKAPTRAYYIGNHDLFVRAVLQSRPELSRDQRVVVDGVSDYLHNAFFSETGAYDNSLEGQLGRSVHEWTHVFLGQQQVSQYGERKMSGWVQEWFASLTMWDWQEAEKPGTFAGVYGVGGQFAWAEAGVESSASESEHEEKRAEVASILHWVEVTYGAGKLRTVYDRLARADDQPAAVNSAFGEVLGQPMDQLVAAWRDYYTSGRAFTPSSDTADSTIFSTASLAVESAAVVNDAANGRHVATITLSNLSDQPQSLLLVAPGDTDWVNIFTDPKDDSNSAEVDLKGIDARKQGGCVEFRLTSYVRQQGPDALLVFWRTSAGNEIGLGASADGTFLRQNIPVSAVSWNDTYDTLTIRVPITTMLLDAPQGYLGNNFVLDGASQDFGWGRTASLRQLLGLVTVSVTAQPGESTVQVTLPGPSADGWILTGPDGLYVPLATE